ncbi:MAG: glycosyl hydrolase family 57 [Elainellaceae cyanobacterium]
MIASTQSSHPSTRPPIPTLQLPEIVNGLPNISGWESEVIATTQINEPVFRSQTNLQLSQVTAAFAIALHMHQPTIPAGSNGELISNLQYMFEHPYEGDNHNASAFAYCYSRMADFIPDLVSQGCNPRVMLDYSGNLLWGLRQMGQGEILENLKRITCDPAYQPYVEWLGTLWGHGVTPSTPIADLTLHMRAWQHHFASIFGWQALARVKGFSLPEMHLPNHPDTLYTLVTALRDCGYRWLLVQEHSIETLAGGPITNPHIPHRLVAHDSEGKMASIAVLIKTQGSDTKLVGQMQPYAEAKTLSPQPVGDVTIPPLVTQIGDGENGGVMMNEFPAAFRNAWYEIRDRGGNTGVMGMNGTEYLELVEAAGCRLEDLPACQAIAQHRIWQRVDPDQATPETVAAAIEALRLEDASFHMDGGSWTNHLSWVKGYQNVLSPMNDLSARFHRAIATMPSADAPLTRQHRYRNALLHNLLLQTSCFRYWGQGTWTDYAQELYRRGLAILQYDF